MDTLIPAMSKRESVIEVLKAEDQLPWVGRMNNIRNRLEEIILHELVYSKFMPEKTKRSIKIFKTIFSSL